MNSVYRGPICFLINFGVGCASSHIRTTGTPNDVVEGCESDGAILQDSGRTLMVSDWLNFNKLELKCLQW